MPTLAVPFRSKRRESALLLQKLQHVVPAVPLLMQGLERLRHEAHGWSMALGAAEVVTSVLVVGAFGRVVRAARTARRGPGAAHAGHHSVDWVDLFLSGMLAIEVWAHWYETGHIKRPTVLLATVMLVLGLRHGRIVAFAERRRGLRLDDHGLSVSTRPFSRFTAAWNDLAAIDLTPTEARITRRDGRTKVLDLADLHNAADVRAMLEAARLRLPVAAPETPPDAGPAADAPAQNGA